MVMLIIIKMITNYETYLSTYKYCLIDRLASSEWHTSNTEVKYCRKKLILKPIANICVFTAEFSRVHMSMIPACTFHIYP